MKRAIVKFQDGGYCNIEADYIDADDKYISVHLGDKIMGIFELEYIKAAYISEKN
jgi:hypothetical protein